MALFIQLIGQHGVGKSFFARKLAEVKNGVVLSFSKDVYRLAALVKGREIDKREKQDRELLRLIGTAWGRESREISEEVQRVLENHKPKEWGTPDIWARIFVSNCRSLPATVSIVNDDTRFLNELEISMATLGFIPVLVACREETRQKRLKERGDMHDPSDTDHLSEEIANFLSVSALSHPHLPVIWNDTASSKPLTPWIFEWNEFRSTAEQSDSNLNLAEQLDWTPARAEALVAVLKAQLDPQPEAISMNRVSDLNVIKNRDVSDQRAVVDELVRRFGGMPDGIEAVLAEVPKDELVDLSVEAPEQAIRYALLAMIAADIASIPYQEGAAFHMEGLKELASSYDLSPKKIVYLMKYAGEWMCRLETLEKNLGIM